MKKELEIMKNEIDDLKTFAKNNFLKEQIDSQNSLFEEDSKESFLSNSIGGSLDSIRKTSRKSSKKIYHSNIFKKD